MTAPTPRGRADRSAPRRALTRLVGLLVTSVRRQARRLDRLDREVAELRRLYHELLTTYHDDRRTEE